MERNQANQAIKNQNLISNKTKSQSQSPSQAARAKAKNHKKTREH
jgi:hypothetical protein